MGCAPSTLAPADKQYKGKAASRKQSSASTRESPKKQSSEKRQSSRKKTSSGKEKTLQRLFSANSGTVFHLGPDVQKGVETRLRRLSAPVIPAGLTAEDFAPKAPSEKHPAPANSVVPSSEGKPADSSGVDAHEQQQHSSVEVAVVASTEKPVVEENTRTRRMSVLGSPPIDEDATSSNESAADAGDTSLILSSVFRSVYADGRSKSAQWRQLEDFNLMEHVFHSVASLSRAGREPSYRKTNQDNCFAYQQYLHPSQALFGAMDGHGPNGHKVSAFVKKKFPIILAKQQEHEDDNVVAAGKAFVAMQKALEESSVDCEFSGSTAVCCFLHGRQLTTAWVGDSRAVLARQEHRGLRGISLTKDHKPAAHTEKLRIQAAGGRVERLLDSTGRPVGPHRVWLAHSWVPGLAMSRALGDAVAHTAGVIAVPDTDVTNITPQDRFLILASDGVWEFINSQTAVELIADCTNAEQACRILVDAAHDRWVEEEQGVVDDITVVVAKFK